MNELPEEPRSGSHRQSDSGPPRKPAHRQDKGPHNVKYSGPISGLAGALVDRTDAEQHAYYEQLEAGNEELQEAHASGELEGHGTHANYNRADYAPKCSAVGCHRLMTDPCGECLAGPDTVAPGYQDADGFSFQPWGKE